MQRVQLVLVVVSATRTFVPAAPAVVPAAMPALETARQPWALSAEQLAVQHTAAPQPQAGREASSWLGVEPVAAFAVAGVAAAAAVSSLRRSRPSRVANLPLMQGDSAAKHLWAKPSQSRLGSVVMEEEGAPKPKAKAKAKAKAAPKAEAKEPESDAESPEEPAEESAEESAEVPVPVAEPEPIPEPAPLPLVMQMATGGGQESGLLGPGFVGEFSTPGYPDSGVWDPLNLATAGSDRTLKFFRHAEIKHGRVAMAAMVGFLVHINHITFPGQIGQGVTFESLSQMGPFEAWSGLPMWGQAQIIAAIGGLEFASECRNPDGHYMLGGTPGDLKFLRVLWDPMGFTDELSPEELERKRNAELKNGRLAMIGMLSIIASINLPGSVPFLNDAPVLTGPGFVSPFSVMM